MAGYTRQSSADIVAGEVVAAAPLNAEFNALQAAFHATTGHTHDGTAGNGPKLPLTTSVSGILPAANGGVGAALTSTTDNTIPRFNGTGGIMQTSSAVIDDDGNLTLTNTDAGTAANPKIFLFRNSASPAASDALGHFLFQGTDSGGNTHAYADFFSQIVDPTDASEDGSMTFRVMVAGTITNRIVLNTAGITLSGITTIEDLVVSDTVEIGTSATIDGRTVPTVWDGTAGSEDDYPIGHRIPVHISTLVGHNTQITPIYALNDNSIGGIGGALYMYGNAVPPSGGPWTSVELLGTWRSRGCTLAPSGSGSGFGSFGYVAWCERTA